LRGSCGINAPQCGENEIINLDFASETACTCGPLHAAEAIVYDLSLTQDVKFSFEVGDKFTIREWAMSDGTYEWDLPADHAWAKCLAPVGEAFDDGRYRQVSYEAVKGDCIDRLVRTPTNLEEGADPAQF
jgi:hypothetical protein